MTLRVCLKGTFRLPLATIKVQGPLVRTLGVLGLKKEKVPNVLFRAKFTLVSVLSVRWEVNRPPHLWSTPPVTSWSTFPSLVSCLGLPLTIRKSLVLKVLMTPAVAEGLTFPTTLLDRHRKTLEVLPGRAIAIRIVPNRWLK